LPSIPRRVVKYSQRRQAILWFCRFLENAFFWLGDFFEGWGDHFDDALHAELRKAIDEARKGKLIKLEVCPHCGRFDFPDE
jgi:hypothetical protein